MISVSEVWKGIHERFLLPETHIQIDCTITETAVQETATISGVNEAVISNTISSLYDVPKSTKYATNEMNFWALDGSRVIAPDSAPYENIGYVSDTDSAGSVTVSLPEIHTSTTSGLTITWGGRYDEYPSTFEVIAKRGEEVVSYRKVENNDSQVTALFEQLQDYDNIVINVLDWSLPNRRVRIENVIIGHVLTFGKDDIFSYTHEQTGHLNSGELPKNSITFTLDNTEDQWNPTGMGQYLSERQKIKVRYGLDVGESIEWITAGTFYLSEWKVPSNGMEAQFVARDIFEYLLNETYREITTSGTLYELCEAAIDSADVPDDFHYVIDDSLRNYSATLPEREFTCAEIIQMCANASGCVVYQDRDGVLHIERLNKVQTDYIIPLSLSYSQPEIELSKPLKSVSVSYGGDTPYVLSVGSSGETQTVDNPLITTQHEYIAEWVRDTLFTRKTISGEYRADPRLDLFDIVVVQSKYGDIINVAITDIKYSYSGAFRATYTGRVLGGE